MIGNNEILNYLLVKEDFLPEPTDIGDGKLTIGSGLTDSKWIDLYKKRGNKWSKDDNRKAVLEEIQKRRLWAEQNVPHWNSLPEPSQDALLSYRYNYNFTPKNSPKLFKALEDKNYLEAARQIDATSKNPDFKNGLLKRRKEEQQWFLSGFPKLSKPNNFAIPYKYPAPEYPTAAEAYRKSMTPITGNYSQGGQLQNHKQWKDLSYSEKNDIIKVAVRNGITTLPEIRQKYNEFVDEGNLYAGGGYVYDMLPQLFASDGVQVRVTSGYRPNSKVQGSGKPSRHSMHEAADIVGDFSAIRRVLDNPESNTAKWMRANGYGYLDETSKTGTKKFWHDQKGDHSHYHIGKDSGIAKKFAANVGSINNVAPIVSTGNYLDIAKAHIRNNEGWSPMPVADGPKNTGWRSVGYGFNDSGFRAKYPQGISKAYENGITKAQAEQELDYILGNMDSHLRRVYGNKWNSFNDNQKAAILDTYYQRPASVVGRNSAFYNAVMRDDNNAVNYLGVAGYDTRNNDRRKLFSSAITQMPEAAQTVQQPLFYQPWNPQATNSYTPYSPLTPYPAPIFSPEEQEEYFAKQIAQAQKQQEAEQREKQRQEKADRINRFSLLMNLTDPYSSDSSSSSTPFADAVNMLTQRSPIQYFSNGGSIFIKPENRGKFTRLKERTGHSASWFKENGTPAQKKMATFALNARHWKHGLGGNLFENGGKKDNNPKPVTTGGAGYVPSTSNIDIRQRLYDNVVPFGYNNPVERIASAVFLNKPSNKQEYVGNRDILDDLWGTYLGIPKNRRHYNPVLKTSKYKPTNSKGSNQDYVSIPFANDDIDHIIKEALWQGERSQLLNPELGTFTVDTGRDKKGQYVSYYDKWDLNPFRGITNVGNKVTNFIGLNKAGDLSFGIGKPIEIYDRIYLDDYYGVPYPYRGATYLPEVTVYGKKKKKVLGGNLFKDGGDSKSGIPVTYFTQSEAMPLLADNPNRTAVLDEVTVRPYKKLPMQSELFQGITNQAANERADEYANRVTPTAEDLLNIGTLGGLNNLSPTQWARRAYDLREAIKGNMSWDKFGNNWFYGNNGLVSNKYAQEHPYASAAINLAGDIGAFGTFSALRKLPKYATLMKAENKAAQEAAALNWRDMLSNSVKRTRIGDVEIDNPGLYYHQSDAGKAKNFVSTGRMRTPLEEYWLAKEGAGEHIPTKLRAGIEPGYPQDPGSAMFSQGNLWYDKLNGITVNPMKPDLLVTAKEMPIANKNASIMSDKASLKVLYEQGTRRVTNDNIYTQGPHNRQNTAAYTWEPEYGYRRVFAEETPTLNWVNTARTPQITAKNTANYPSITADADDFSYKGLSSIKSNVEKIIYNNKIHGKPMYPSDEGITGFSKNVQTGVPKTEYNKLLHDVIGRNVREFKRAGLNDAQVSGYINNARNAMDNVHIGMYSNSDYIKGGWEGFGGFYDSEGNFISVNTGSPLSKTKVVKHEGRHLLDHKVDDEILMPTSESFGNNFDSDVVLSTMQKVKQNQNMILYDAYDNDFITLPNKEGFNDGLKGYSNMGREAVTTNLDSRNTLLGSKAGWDFDTTDKIIDKMPDAAIFEAVEKANGYGRRFIKFLRENNKLTPKKAQQFREAMKHVGAYAAPVGVTLGTSAATLYNKSK